VASPLRAAPREEKKQEKQAMSSWKISVGSMVARRFWTAWEKLNARRIPRRLRHEFAHGHRERDAGGTGTSRPLFKRPALR
jgi:hypothetical protein